MYKHLVIVGAGGHGQAIADLALSLNKFQKISFLDDSYPEKTSAIGLSITGKSSALFEGNLVYDSCFVAIGNNRVRKQLVSKIIESELPLICLFHPKAWISGYADVRVGTAVMAGAVVGTNAKLGLASLVNANVTVDHDCILHDFSHLGVGVQLAGGVEIGAESWLQAGCSAGYGVKVASLVTISPGSILVPIL